MRHLKKIMAISLVVVMSLGLFACGPSSAITDTDKSDVAATEEDQDVSSLEYATPEYTLVFSTGDSETNLMSQVFADWADKVYEVTKGRVEVEMHYNGELVNTGMALTALQQGTVDVAFVVQGTDASFQLDPLVEAVSAFSMLQRPSTVYTELLQHEDFAAPYEGYKVVMLASQWNGVIGMTDTKVTAPEDLAGKNIAVTSSLAATTVGNIGASGVFCEPNSEYTSLEKGVVDGAWYLPWDSMISQSWGELLDYITMMPRHNSTNGVLMNKATWESLPAEVQEQIDSLQPWLLEEFDKRFVERSIECMQYCEEEYGCEFVWLTDEEKAAFQAYTDEAVANFVAELDGQGIDASGFIELYNELAEKYSAEEYRFVDFDWTGPVW